MCVLGAAGMFDTIIPSHQSQGMHLSVSTYSNSSFCNAILVSTTKKRKGRFSRSLEEINENQQEEKVGDGGWAAPKERPVGNSHTRRLMMRAKGTG